jgi:hypothetical protein
VKVGGLILVDIAEEVFLFLEEHEIEADEIATTYSYGLQNGAHDQPEGAIWVSNVLDHDANAGYDVVYSLLKLVNGEKVINIESIKDVISKNISPWLVLEFYGGQLAVFKQLELEKITQDLISEYKILESRDNHVFCTLVSGYLKRLENVAIH